MINWESWGFLVVIVNQHTKGSQMMENRSTLRAGTMEIFFEDINEDTFGLEIHLSLERLS